ncbi:YkoP family protein [Paenibacillus alginolyticus]|uniref:YkoP family protein n=1 Tax=Paenibacillus alginolyticus TaxID=59839 RepID=UPI001FE509DA|nr:polysaccharide deacetylase [Paenibacillus frigoriresistens]
MTAALMKTSLQSLWIMWEHVFDFLNRFRSESVWRYGICKLVVRQHRGKRITCQDGRRILAGDWVGELHLDNRQVLRLTRTVGADRAGLSTARMFRLAIKQISQELDSIPELVKVQALTGITLLHRGIIHGIGFEQHPIASKWQQRFYASYLRILLRILHPDGNQRIGYNTEKLSPMMLVISKQSLKERFTVRKKDSKPSPLDGYQDLQSQGKKEAVS